MFNPVLMRKYPKTKRTDIITDRAKVSEEERQVARRFDKTYFDTDRKYGYGGYSYDPRFFSDVVKDFIYYYDLKPGARILDVGCAKGFMLYDFKKADPSFDLHGIDVSDYALSEALPDVKKNLRKACCSELPYEDNSFDLVISISTIHNLDIDGVRKSLQEIMRVTRNNAFIKVNGYRNLRERETLDRWNLVAKTILHDNEWSELFEETRYTGDFDFFRT